MVKKIKIKIKEKHNNYLKHLFIAGFSKHNSSRSKLLVIGTIFTVALIHIWCYNEYFNSQNRVCETDSK